MAEPTRTTGRPPKLTQVILTDPDGTKITVHDRIVSSLRAGNYIEASAALAGVTKHSVYEWLKIGAQAHTDVSNGRRRLTDLRKHERDCMTFSDAVAEAQAAAEVRDVAQLAQLANGGAKVKVVTTKKVDGKVTEVIEREEVLPPNPQVIEWRLERRFPDRWGRRRLEVSGPGGEAIPVEARVAGIVAAARAFHGTETGDARADDGAGELPVDAADEVES